MAKILIPLPDRDFGVTEVAISRACVLLRPLITSALFVVAGSACAPGAPPSRATAAATSPSMASSAAAIGPYPPTRATDTADTIFGTVVRDPYRWLEDGSSPEVQAWTKAQDDFARARLAKLPERDAIASRLHELFSAEAMRMPERRGGRLFYSKRTATQEKYAIYVREANGKERVVLDPNTWPTESNPSLYAYNVSWDGKKIAYSVNLRNADDSVTHVLDVGTGKDFPDLIPGTNFFSVFWTGASDALYYRYTPSDPRLQPADRAGLADLRYHRIGTDPGKDVVVHESTKDSHNFLWVDASRDGHWVFTIVDHGASLLDLYFKDARGPQTSGGWIPLAVGRDAEYAITAYRDRFYVLTNDGASRYRVFVVDPAHPDRSAWKEIVRERADATLRDASIVGGKLVLAYLKDVITHVEIHELDGTLVREIAPPSLGTVTTLHGEQDGDTAYYAFESYTAPREIFDTSVKTGATKSFYRTKLPFDGERFGVEQRFFESKDGTRVPMFIVRRKDAPKPTPVLLYAYGSFGYVYPPAFDTRVVPWLERGGAYAVVFPRGGGEYGEAWHRAGNARHKQNTYDDFIAGAELLVRAGYTTPAALVIEGYSGGGQLVAAVITQRPDLFRAAICGAPLTDMVRYTRVGAGKLWISELGSPEVEPDFRALYAYSPYHHVVAATAYPSVLMDSEGSDDRVDPMHARKFVAALQAASRGGSILLRVEHEAGHAGATTRAAWVEGLADDYAFALAEVRDRGSALRSGAR